MGESTRKTAACDDILHDVRKTHENAAARRGVSASLAERRLWPVLEIIASIKAQQEAAQAVASPLFAALAAADIRADKTVGKVSDNVWNDVGRPASDAALDLLFPGGNAFYMDGDATEQPDRMDVLVELLPAGVHPKLSAEVASACIATITAERAALRLARDGLRQEQGRGRDRSHARCDRSW